jgi:TRAP-type C4-dicarboxylate transport system substrate-binding protein
MLNPWRPTEGWRWSVGGATAGLLLGLAGVAGAQTIQVRIPQALSANNPRVVTMAKFGQRLEKESQGRFKVAIYPGGQLYGAREAVRAAAVGDVEMANEPESHYITFSKTFRAIDIPFLFKDTESFHRFLQEKQKLFARDLEARGMVLLGLWDEGPMIIGSRRALLKTPADYRGLKIRSSGHELLARAWNSLGAASVNVPIEEMYTALQQGVADAIYTTFNTFVSAKHYEVAPKVILSPSRSVYVWVANKGWRERLPAQDQQLIRRLGDEATAEFNKLIWADYAGLVQTVKAAKGGEFYEPSAADLEAFRAAIQPLLQDWKKEFGELLAGLL